MTDLLKKLGIRPGHWVCLLDPPSEAEAAIRAGAHDSVSFSKELEEVRFDIILFWPQELAGLAGHFDRLQRRIHPDGAIWAVMPKKKFARQRGIGFSWEEMQAAGLQTDLVDNKIASITEEEYGTRFVIRKERRAK